MQGGDRLKNRSWRERFWNVYYRVAGMAFLVSFGGALMVALVQFGTRGVIQVSFAQTAGTLQSSASVPPNSVNSLNEKLKQKETMLAQKENELTRAEFNLGEMLKANEARLLAYLLSISGALFLLILLNFFLDFKQRKFNAK